MIARADRFVGRVGDALLAAAVVALALWALVYDAALPAGAAVDPLLAAWLGCCTLVGAVAAVVAVRRRRRRAEAPTHAGRRPARPGAVPALLWLGAALAAAAAAAGLRTISWPGAWVAPAAVVVASLVAAGRRHGSRRHAAAPAAAMRTAEGAAASPAARGHILAAAVSVGLGVGSLFTFWPSGDDVYYVNRAVWVAAHARIPLRDTIFGNQALPAMRGQKVPIAGIEALQGALAHLFGAAAPTVVYLVTPPIATTLAVWALWRLVRAWMPRRALLALGVALVYVIWSAQTLTTQWDVHLVGMWQGKSIMAAVTLPLLYAQLTDWLSERRPGQLALIGATGAAAVGLSSTGVFVVPLVAAAAAVPMLLRRDVRALLGPAAAVAYPVAAGLAVHFATPAGGPGNGPPRPGSRAFGFVVGTGAVAVVGVAALLAAPHLLRRRAARGVALGAAAMTVAVAAPGAMSLFQAATGAGPVLWRALWVAPLAAAVAAVVAVPGPAWGRLLAPATAIAVLVTLGTPPWDAPHPLRFVATARWQVDPDQLAEARLVARAAPRGATVLAPVPVMETLAETTARVSTAAPRDIYSLSLDENPSRSNERVLLAHWVSARPPVDHPSPEQLRTMLTDVGVDYACVAPGARGSKLYQAGYGLPVHVGPLVCFDTSTPPGPAPVQSLRHAPPPDGG